MKLLRREDRLEGCGGWKEVTARVDLKISKQEVGWSHQAQAETQHWTFQAPNINGHGSHY